jgi:hypothetical protein
MKTAIKIPGSTPITPKQFKDLVKGIKTLLEDWNFGNVDVYSPPGWVVATFGETLSRLNSLGRQYKITTGRSDEKCTLLYGRGSLGKHSDQVNGLNILTFLGSFCPEEIEEDTDPFSPSGPNIPEYHHRDGQFFQGKFIEMRQGDSILCDDDEDHAWISNAYWIFASVPVRRLPKPRLSVRVPSTKKQCP